MNNISKVRASIKRGIINTVRQHQQKPRSQENKHHVSRVSARLGEGQRRVLDKRTDYMSAYEVIYATKRVPKWAVSLNVNSPTWKELHNMNIWQQEKWIKQNNILRR